MTYCSNCGERLPKDALFCSKCGKKTLKGVESNAATPTDEVREAFTKMSQEMEKAFNIAAKEMQEAFKIARNNIQKTFYNEPVNCPNCGEKNPSNAIYCYKCGKKLQGGTTEKPKTNP